LLKTSFQIPSQCGNYARQAHEEAAMQQGNKSVKHKLILALQSSASQPEKGARVGDNG
jgi:hypothetical protein